MRSLAILGSTGSIGTSTLEVVRAHPDLLSVRALAAGRNRDLLRAQCEAYRPRCVSVGSREDADWLRSSLSYLPQLHWGEEGLRACALHHWPGTWGHHAARAWTLRGGRLLSGYAECGDRNAEAGKQGTNG